VTSIPEGWLLCDGAEYRESDHKALFDAIRRAHGGDPARKTFRVPDYQGRFLRGQAHGRSTDPDRATRSAMATNGNSGDAIGSVQSDELREHRHIAPLGGGGSEAGKFIPNMPNGEGTNPSIPTKPTGGQETRPVNAYVNYLIKF
jgi:microcystin-dependent protein